MTSDLTRVGALDFEVLESVNMPVTLPELRVIGFFVGAGLVYLLWAAAAASC